MYVYKWKENILMLDNFEVFRQLFFLPPTGGGIFCVDRKYGAIRIIGIEKQETLKSKTLWSVEGNLKQSIWM